MKKMSFLAGLVLTAVFVLSAAFSHAQDSIQYQLVIRNSAGQLITNKQVSMKFSLIGGEQTYYQETMPATTDKFGNISVMVGTGKALKGAMKDVPWSTMEISLKVEADTEGGEKYAELGTVPIAAAPYAMYAATAGGNASSGSPKGDEALFEVCDRDGQPVFAVYDDGIVVYVDQNSADKAKRSGLVVTGRKATKDGETADYFAVDAEGTHIYIDDADDNTKAKRSGFVVTGRKATKDGAADSKPFADDRSATKADGAEVFAINGGLTTIYVDDTDDNAKAKRSGFVVTGRKATKEGENIIDIDAYHANLATDELSISENTVEQSETQSGELPEPVQPKSMFTVTGGNVQMNTEVSMIGDMEKKVEADILEEAPMITVNDDLYVFNGLQYFAENEPRITDLALMAIYDDGAYVPKTDENFILFDESGFVTKQHSQAAVVLELNKKEPVVSIRPLKPMNKTIEFGLMDANNVTEPYQFVKLTAKIEAETGLPFVLGESENGKVIVNGELFYGERVELTAVPDPGYVFKDWGSNSLTDNPRRMDIGIYYEPITAQFAEPKLYVKASSVDDQGGSDSNSGFSEDEPLASINGAINRIRTSNSETNWIINVIGEITGEQIITDNEGTTPVPAETITITGQSNSKDGGQGVLKGEWDGDIDTGQSTKASILSVKTSVPIIVENLTITRGYAVQGGAINIGIGGNVTLGNGAFVTENMGTLCAGIYIEGGGDGENTKSKLIIADGCQITKNTTNDCGGGVRTLGKVEIVMTGGEIKDNKVRQYHGGGLYLDGGAEFYMTGGIINSNKADNGNGGGIYATGNSLVVIGGSAVIGDTEITDASEINDDNCANQAAMGGGIYSTGDLFLGYKLKDDATELIADNLVKDEESSVTIQGNYANTTSNLGGGGVYVGGKFDMASGSISGNQANNGGGVMATAIGGAEFTMIGGEIAGNSAAKGSGVYVGTCTFTMSGDARVNADNDVYLASGQKITIGGAFSGSDIVATITPTNYNTALANPVLGGESELVESLCGRFAVTPGRTQSDGDLKYWRVGSDGKLQELIGTKAVPDAVGDIVFTDGSAVPYSEDLALTQGQKNAAVAVIFDAENKKGVALGQSSDQTRWCAETTLSGYGDVPGACGQDNGWVNTNAIYELSDFEMNSGNYPPFEYAKGYTAGGYTDWYIPAIHELQAIQSKNAILNQAINKVGGTSITLAQYTYYWSSSQDERGGNDSNYAYSVRFDNYAVESTTKVGDAMYRQVAYSRCVRQFGGNNNSSKLTTYYVAPNATNGGIGNDSNNGLSANSPFETLGKALSMMTEAKDYQLVACGWVQGNQVIENIPEGSTLTIMGNRNNETDALDANNSGTVLEIKTSVPVTIKNLRIIRGGACGIKIEDDNANVTLDAGALVVSNSAGQDGLGGGVYIAGGKLTMHCGSKISGNQATSSGGGIYIAEGATFDMKGGTIESNQAGYFGQSVYVGGTFNMSGGTIESNPSYYDGGDVRVNRNAVFNIKGTAKIDNNDYVLLDSYSDEYATINIAGELEGTGRVAIIKPLNYDDDIPLLTSSVAGYLPTDRFAVEMNEGIVWNITSDGKLKGDFTKGKGTMKSLKGVFTVSSDGKKVQFSSGNLNYYRAQPKRWEFAAHQYDAIRYDNVVYPAPSYRASFNDNIDLFGYGTSGYNSRTPDLNVISNDTYWSYNLTGDGGANYDWGVKITEDYNTTEQWRTLTQTEWTYLLASRTSAKQLYGLATVAGVSGLILLPDNWSSDGMPAFTSGTTGGYDNNTYSSEQWAQMEENGAVFLPITGYRSGTMSNGEVVMSVEDYYYAGYYWSATAGKCLHFYTSSTKNECKVDDGSRANGYAVRLVHDYEETFFGTKAPGSNLEVGDIVFSDGSAMPYSEGLTLDESQKEAAIAVIFYVGTDGDALGKRTLGIGKYNSTANGSNDKYAWSKGNGVNNDLMLSMFSDILSYTGYTEPGAGEPYVSYSYSGIYYITGDLDGSDNWEKVKEKDSDYANNYPGFEWVDGYANKYNLPNNYKDGWYMPSAAELIMLWKNLNRNESNNTFTYVINTILTTMGGTTLGEGDYLTSNRTYEDGYISLTVSFDGSPCSRGLNTVKGYVCAIREF